MAIETILTYAVGPPDPPTSTEDWVLNYFCHWIQHPEDPKQQYMCGDHWDGHDVDWGDDHYFHSGVLVANKTGEYVKALREQN